MNSYRSANVETVPPSEAQRSHFGTTTALTLYLQEIGQVKLLTPKEEIDLATRIQAGDQEARQHMIRANLRLVVKIARDYEGSGLPLLDLINEGNIGLMKAVDRFDPAKGAKLSTYSSWWIKQQMRRALSNQSKTIRLPIHVVDKLYHLRRAEARMWEILGREPSDFELAAETGFSALRVSRLRRAALRPASLDAPLGQEETSALSEIVQDEQAVDPYQQLEDRTSLERLGTLLPKLAPREASILRSRFGLDGSPQRTLEQIGESLGVTRERIRQVQNIALQKLRHMLEENPEATLQVAA